MVKNNYNWYFFPGGIYVLKETLNVALVIWILTKVLVLVLGLVYTLPCGATGFSRHIIPQSQSINSAGPLQCFQTSSSFPLSTAGVYVCDTVWGDRPMLDSLVPYQWVTHKHSNTHTCTHTHTHTHTLVTAHDSQQLMVVPVLETDMVSWSGWCILKMSTAH